MKHCHDHPFELTESQFLECSVVRLRVHEVNEQKLKCDPTTVDGKVPPPDTVNGDGVDVYREESGQFSEHLLDADTHSSLRVREKLNEVCVGQRIVADVVARRVGEVKEQRGNLCRLIGFACVFSDLQAAEADGHCHENHGHGTGGKHEHPATAEPGDDQSDYDSVGETPALVGDIDARLGEVRSISHHLEQQVLVVRQQCVSTHLGEKSEEARDEHTSTHTLGPKHIEPRLLGVLHFEFDCRSYLSHLGLHED